MRGVRGIRWEEVEQHASRDDKWIVIDDEVYDVTGWSRRHPGGSRLLSHYAGQDATVRNSGLTLLVREKVGRFWSKERQRRDNCR